MARALAATFALCVAALGGAPAHGQGGSDKAIKLQVPFATGGGRGAGPGARFARRVRGPIKPTCLALVRKKFRGYSRLPASGRGFNGRGL